MKKVLLASSSKSILSRNSSLLADKGFQFFTSSRGAEALRLHDEQVFDLIISDLELADMDGCQLCSEVRNSGKNVPVVIFCHDNVEYIEKVKQSDAAALLLRPIDPTQLLVTIGSYIDMQLARSKRVEFKEQVVCQNQRLEFLSDSHDISVTGILLETESQLDMGSRLSCRFNLPDAGQIQAEVEVARHYPAPNGRKSFYGVKFINLPMSGGDAIKKYIALNPHLGIKQNPHNSIKKSMGSATGSQQK